MPSLIVETPTMSLFVPKLLSSRSRGSFRVRPKKVRTSPFLERLDERVLLSFSGAAVVGTSAPIVAQGQDDDTLGLTLSAGLQSALAGKAVPLAVVAHPDAAIASLQITVTGQGVFAGVHGVQKIAAPFVSGTAEYDLSALEAATGGGGGQITAVVSGLGADGQVLARDEADVYAVYDTSHVWGSSSSDFDAQVNRLQDLLAAGTIDATGYAAGLDVLINGPSPVVLAPSGGVSAESIHTLAAPTRVTISGTILWTDGAGGTHPVPLAPIEVYATDATTNKLLTATPATTDSTGRYSIDVTPDATLTSLFIKAYARSPYDDVQAQTAGATTYSMKSTAKPVAGAALTLDKTAGNALTNERAFAVDWAMVDVGAYTSTLTGKSLPSLKTIFPQIPAPGNNPVSFFSSTNKLKLMNVRNTAWNQPDVTDHEYGHYVASVYKIVDSPGGSHTTGSNNAVAAGKKGGIGLAFSEGWATYFAISGQDASNASAQGVPTYGDHSYNGLGTYSLDTLAASGNATGEDDEGSADGVLWNMYLTSKDATSSLHYTDKTIFDLLTGAKTTTIGAVWEAAAAKLDNKGKTQLGKIFSDMMIAPTPTAPADHVDIKPSDPIPTFTWTNNGGGAPNPLNEFKVLFLSNDYSKKVFESPVGETTVGAATSSFKPTADEWKTITDGGPRLHWVVEGKNKSAPATPGGTLGYYWSPARTIGAQVGIAFVIDVTGSMSGEIAGVRDALQSYIDEVAATVPAGDPAPTIELITFRDSPAVVITSNDLAAVRTAVAGLGASGGGDCPEPSANALQVAAADIGPGGTVLLATDASSDPGIDISAVITQLRAKGVSVNVNISGDCSGIDSLDSGPTLASLRTTKVVTDSSAVKCDSDGQVVSTHLTKPTPATPAPAVATTVTIIPGPKALEGGIGDDTPEDPLGPIDVTLGAPITIMGNTIDTATPLIVNGSATRGLTGTGTALPDIFSVALKAGVTYAVEVNVEAGDPPLVEVLDRDGTTVLGSHQTFTQLDSGQILNRYVIAVTPAADGTYFIRLTGSAAGTNPSFYTLRVTPDPLAAATSSVVAFSSVSAQTGGSFSVHDEVKGGITTAYIAAMFNAMSSTLGPAVVSASPINLPQSQTTTIVITGRKTNWRQGQTTVAFPDGGITVQSVTVTSPTTLTAVLTTAADAKLGFKSVVVTSKLGTKSETAKGSNVVDVNAPITSATLLSVTPGNLSRGNTTDVVILGANTTWGSTSKVGLGPGVKINSFKVVSPTEIDANVTIDPSAQIAFRTARVNTGTGSDVTSRALFIDIGALAIPVIVGLTPTAGHQGSTLDVAITGANTHFVAGSTHADFGTGVSVISLTVTDPTHATAHVTVAADSPLGFHDVFVTTGAESAALLRGFFIDVSGAAGSLVSVTPGTVMQGGSTVVTIHGSNTLFDVTATVSFGDGITVVNTTVIDPTDIAVTIVAAPDAPLGPHDVTVTTGTDIQTLPGGLTVAISTPPQVVRLVRIDPSAHQPTYLIVFYTQPMDPKSAGSAKNYVVVDTGPDRKLGTSDDQFVKLAGVKYNSKNSTVTIATQDHLLFRHTYAIIIKSGGTRVGGVMSGDGVPLDGSGKGNPGTNAKIKFGPGKHVTGLAHPVPPPLVLVHSINSIGTKGHSSVPRPSSFHSVAAGKRGK